MTGFPSDPRRTEVPLTRSGNASDAGLPTASRVALGTDNASTTLADSALVPGSPVAACPPLLRWEAAAAGPVLPVALITTMVATAATTRPTGTRAATTGWRRRKGSCDGTDRCSLVPRGECLSLARAGCARLFEDLGAGRAARGPEVDFDISTFSCFDVRGWSAHARGSIRGPRVRPPC